MAATRKAKITSKLSELHLIELWRIWHADNRVPTPESRKAWAEARKAPSHLVDNWFLRRKKAIRKARRAIPKEMYELVIGDPPEIKQELLDEQTESLLSAPSTPLIGDELSNPPDVEDTPFSTPGPFEGPDIPYNGAYNCTKRSDPVSIPPLSPTGDKIFGLDEDALPGMHGTVEKIDRSFLEPTLTPELDDTLVSGTSGLYLEPKEVMEEDPATGELTTFCNQGDDTKSDFACCLCLSPDGENKAEFAFNDKYFLLPHSLFQPTTLNILLDGMALDRIYPYVRISAGTDSLMELSSIPFLSRTPDLIHPMAPLSETLYLDPLYCDYAMDEKTKILGSHPFFRPAFEYVIVDPLHPFGEPEIDVGLNEDVQQRRLGG